HLLTSDAEVINEPGYRSIRMDRDMRVLMHQEIVAWPLTNDAEVVDKAGLKSHLAVELTLGYSCPLILVTCCQANATYSLRVVMKLRMKAPIAIKRDGEQIVKVPAERNVLPCSSSGTGNKDRDTDGKLGVGQDRRTGWHYEHQSKEDCRQRWEGDEEPSPPGM